MRAQLLAVLLGSGLVFAAEQAPETKSLAGLQGKFTIAGKETGKQSCQWLYSHWMVCDIQQKSWKGQIALGWDAEAKAYRATIVDSTGNSGYLGGAMEGKKLAVTSLNDGTFEGKPAKYRLSWDFTDPKQIKFVYERSLEGGPWAVADEYVLKK